MGRACQFCQCWNAIGKEGHTKEILHAHLLTFLSNFLKTFLNALAACMTSECVCVCIINIFHFGSVCL